MKIDPLISDDVVTIELERSELDAIRTSRWSGELVSIDDALPDAGHDDAFRPSFCAWDAETDEAPCDGPPEPRSFDAHGDTSWVGW